MSDLHLWHNAELGKLRRDMEELFDSLVRDFCSPVDLRLLRCDPAVRVTDEGGGIVVTAKMSNLDPCTLKIEVVGRRLSVFGEMTEGERSEDGFSISLHGFSSTVRLPCAVDPERVRASYAAGVLRIVLPKAAGRTAVRVNVERTNHERGRNE